MRSFVMFVHFNKFSTRHIALDHSYYVALFDLRICVLFFLPFFQNLIHSQCRTSLLLSFIFIVSHEIMWIFHYSACARREFAFA